MRKKIVVTDDDPGVQEIFKIIFEKAGYDTVVLSSARPLLENKYQDADLYLLDRQLSGIDGLDVCRHLKQNEITRHTPVIIVSASPNIHNLCIEAGADEFIEKPFAKKFILERVEQSIKNHTV